MLSRIKARHERKRAIKQGQEILANATEQERQAYFARTLAGGTPLLEQQAKSIAKRIGYDSDKAAIICAGEVVAFNPRGTFYKRLSTVLRQ